MRYVSTRGGESVRIEQAIMGGTAPDGGLYVPDTLPTVTADSFPDTDDLPATAAFLLAPFVAGSSLEAHLPQICQAALNFPVPLRRLDDEDGFLGVLELFHGPTAAFKDVGARFLAPCHGAHRPGWPLCPAAHHHHGRNVRRYRGGRRGRLPSATGNAGRRPVSGGPCLTAPAASAHVLGR